MLSDVSTGLAIAMPPSLAGNDISLRLVSLDGGRSINAGIRFRSSSGWSKLLIFRGSSYYMGEQPFGYRAEYAA